MKTEAHIPSGLFLVTFLWFLLVAVPTALRCQPANLQFDHITTTNGLSQDVVTAIYPDQFGFLWVGTEDGLNRYDGYSVKIYKHSSRDSSTLLDNSISGICDYDDDDLLVATSSGLSVYHRASNTRRNSISTLFEGELPEGKI